MKAATLIPVAFFFLIEEQNAVFRAEGKKLVHMHTKHYHCQLLVFKAPACSSL